MDQEVRSSFLARCMSLSPRDRRNQLEFAGATLAWAVAFVGCTFLLRRDIVPEGPLRWLVAALPTVAGLALFAVFVRYLRVADEFQRVIQLQALGMAFGGTFLAVTGYPLFVALGAPEMRLSDLGTLMPIFYALGCLYGAWRYR